MRKQKPIKHIEVGSYEFNFYFKSDSPKCTYLEIKCGEVATFRIDGRTKTYGYLFGAAQQGLNEQLHGYAALLYIASDALVKDQQFVDDMTAAAVAYRQRKEAEGAERAAAVTENQEAADQTVMEAIVAEADMTEAEREAGREAFKEEVKNVIQEKEDGD